MADYKCLVEVVEADRFGMAPEILSALEDKSSADSAPFLGLMN
jgi:hypothetical protein